MDVDRFCATRPVLYHLSFIENLPLIERYGLMSTKALLDLFEVEGELRERLLTNIRRDSCWVTNARTGERALVRDQHGLSEAALQRVAATTSITSYLAAINERVFFWVDVASWQGMFGSRFYRDHHQVLLTFDTRKLLDELADRVALCRLNSGYVHAGDKGHRDDGLFIGFAAWSQSPGKVREVTVLDRLGDPERYYREPPRHL